MKFAYWLVLIGSIVSTSVNAGAWCTSEKITRIMLGGSNPEVIQFNTDKSCPASGSCVLNTSWSAEAIRRAYALLLAAKSQNKTVELYFDAATSICQAVPNGSAPSVIILSE